MKYSLLRWMVILISCFSTIGCAITSTHMAPPVNEVRHGETAMGKQVSYHYEMNEEKDRFEIKKQPLCAQTVQEIHVERKLMRGIIPALFEIPVFGIGLVDLAAAKAYSESSEIETNGDMVKTGEVLICGDYQAAANAKVIVQYPESETVKHLTTDGDGMVNLKEIFPKNSRDHQINIFVKEKDTISYITTLDETHWN